jgi:hypothetical protein
MSNITLSDEVRKDLTKIRAEREKHAKWLRKQIVYLNANGGEGMAKMFNGMLRVIAEGQEKIDSLLKGDE